MYLSIPLYLLRLTGTDSNFLMVNSLFFMNTLLQVVTDYFIYMLAKKMLGTKGAKISFLFTLFHFQTNTILQRTLTNTPETAFTIAALYFYSDLAPVVDTRMELMTVSITLAFIVRSSSIIGWVPLLLAKMYQSKAYIISFLTVAYIAILLIIISISIDSMFYKRLTCPQYNFLYYNILESLSEKFGVDHWSFYIDQLLDIIS
jgi:phosphatidylinositol glycan class B